MTVVRAHRAPPETCHDPGPRPARDLAGLRRLYSPNYNQEQTWRLYRFVDWRMAPPSEPELD